MFRHGRVRVGVQSRSAIEVAALAVLHSTATRCHDFTGQWTLLLRLMLTRHAMRPEDGAGVSYSAATCITSLPHCVEPPSMATQ